MDSLFPGKTYLVVTGASQGIGRQIAEKFSEYLSKDSCILLLARNEDALKEVARNISERANVFYESVDLSCASAEHLKNALKKPLETAKNQDYQNAVIVHNVGSIGQIQKSTVCMNDMDEWRKYYDLNVFSPAVLNSVFMDIFGKKENTKKIVINITSLLGIQPMKSFGHYCTGKAAREMFFKVFALENPQVDVLNYSPGPVETEMLNTICKDIGNADVQKEFQNLLETRKALTTSETVYRLCTVLKTKKYKSGDHVDYFDDI